MDGDVDGDASATVRPRVLVAPDKFKGTFSAGAVAAAVASGVRSAGAEALELPIADGGDGTAETMLRARGGGWHTTTAADPLGRVIEARFAMLGDGRTAVVDVAEASGLWRLAPEELDPWSASTAGTGQLIVAATQAGAKTVVVAAGGSATVDGGAGALEVLAGAGRLPDIVVACDVTTTWGSAAALYGPQKGATAALVARLEHRLERLADAAPRDPRGVAAAGAAGGLAGGFWSHLDAKLVPGATFVLDAVGFDQLLERVDLVVTGEGRIDEQTLEGKAVGEVARRAAAADRPCAAVVGRDALTGPAKRRLGLIVIVEAGEVDALHRAGRRLAGLLASGT